ncbi:ThuA domain-containing protein [Pelagicoccus sp. SDUM812005]|uniref:ThuA domain-containing protein n=1 Tax=Pelagicoccus sp. SDUM812005 TaxID=3041257 RepID=UPI00280FB14E|nr:ThuA domain-containing protein [Pelagicoccus sp. SDUM812005]MDQ8181415.1 ThuA domain-containing protein [Pelagicoccus sp. SDUM812005]
MTDTIKLTIWNEFRHEKSNPAVQKIYPKGIHSTLAESLEKDAKIEVSTATLDEDQHGLNEEALNNTDVLIWWGHCAHGEVSDEIVEKVQQRVLSGMGLIVLHSGHYSKIFKRLMGSNCSLRWREAAEKERLWNIAPGHPITQGIGEYVELPNEEMYGERFDIPEPDQLIFISWFEGGEVFRSGVTWTRGNGKVFYFRPGHETYPTYHNKDVQQVIRNAVHWAKPMVNIPTNLAPNTEPLESLSEKSATFGEAGIKGQ